MLSLVLSGSCRASCVPDAGRARESRSGVQERPVCSRRCNGRLAGAAPRSASRTESPLRPRPCASRPPSATAPARVVPALAIVALFVCVLRGDRRGHRARPCRWSARSAAASVCPRSAASVRPAHCGPSRCWRPSSPRSTNRCATIPVLEAWRHAIRAALIALAVLALLRALLRDARTGAATRAIEATLALLLLPAIAGGVLYAMQAAAEGGRRRDDRWRARARAALRARAGGGVRAHVRDPGRPRVVLIGIDGASWDRIDRGIAEGRLPTFARLKREGVSAPLGSLVPTYSPPIWTSMHDRRARDASTASRTSTSRSCRASASRTSTCGAPSRRFAGCSTPPASCASCRSPAACAAARRSGTSPTKRASAAP